MLLQPDADGMTGRPQVAADMQVQNLQKHFRGTCARQEPRDRLDLDCMHTGIDKAWSTQRDSMQHLQHGAQCSQRCSWVYLAEHWAGWPGKQLYGAVGTLYCSIYAAAHWTDLRSALAQAVKHNRQREMLQAGSKAISHKVLAMSAVPVVLHFCMELTKDSGIRDAQKKAYV
jgi:hypothetical protein